jgi:NhaA family Na+:H+ antiporter
MAAIGGMTVPALVYLAVTRNEPDAIAGWAIPSETDIAFSLGVMDLFGSRITTSRKLF